MTITPNLLVIGAMKAGTTSFHDMLNQHVDICMSNPKEPVYFTHYNFPKYSYKWYLSLFDDKKIYKYYGESSVSYSKRHNHAFTGIPKRIASVLGDNLKIIYILRDPISRMISHFIDSKNYGHIKPSINVNDYLNNQGLTIHNNQLMTSCYHYQLQEYLKYFPKENILLLEYEDIFTNTEKLRKQLSEFLNIEFNEVKFPELNVTSEKKYYSGLGYNLLKKRTLTDHVKPLLPRFIYNGIRDSKFMKKLLFQSSQNDTNKLNSENEERLKEFFKPEVESLKKNFGFVPQHWRDYSN